MENRVGEDTEEELVGKNYHQSMLHINVAFLLQHNPIQAENSPAIYCREGNLKKAFRPIWLHGFSRRIKVNLKSLFI